MYNDQMVVISIAVTSSTYSFFVLKTERYFEIHSKLLLTMLTTVTQSEEVTFLVKSNTEKDKVDRLLRANEIWQRAMHGFPKE